jgi:hypothetical protein
MHPSHEPLPAKNVLNFIKEKGSLLAIKLQEYLIKNIKIFFRGK